MYLRWSSGIGIVAVILSAAWMGAAESPAAVGVGATRQEVITALGAPTGQSRLGALEILHFRHGQVRLRDGRVERVNLRPIDAPAAPVAEPSLPAAAMTPAHAAAPEPASPFADVWLSDYDAALRDAARRNAPVLVLFTESDASPSARQFQKEIVYHPEFVNAFRAHYVLLEIDFPVRADLPPDLRAQNEALRTRYLVGELPALLLLSSEGEKLAAISIADSAPGNAFRGRLIAAVRVAYELPALALPPPAPPVAEPLPPLRESSQIHVAPEEVTSGLSSARRLIVAALCVGTLLAGAMLFLLWVLLRKLNKPVARTSMASRISQAASGIPTHAELLAWPREKISAVTARLAETEGFESQLEPSGSDKDIVLTRPGGSTPEVLVRCVSGNAGVIPSRRIREIVGLMAAENVPAGWFVSPMGFSLDARTYAGEHNIRLLDGARLLEKLSDLPTFTLPKVLASRR